MYFDPRDVAEISAVMKRVLDDQALRQSLIERGSANVQRFAWERAAREIVEIVTTF